MMVFEVRDTRESGTDQDFAGTTLPAGDIAYFPADRCTWKYVTPGVQGETESGYAAGQYRLREAWFYSGHQNGVSLVNNNTNVTLGYIGKTGRFVGMTGQQLT